MRIREFPPDLLQMTFNGQGIFLVDQQTSQKAKDLRNSPSPEFLSDLSSAPSPDPSPKCSIQNSRQVNPLPRHKRESHINAEHRRRSKIQRGFDSLKVLVPSIGEGANSKESKSALLFKAAEHCRQLKAECKREQDEANSLRKEIEALGTEIDFFVRPLFDSFTRMVRTTTQHEFVESIKNWQESMLSLVNLRRGIVNPLRQISTKTSIMTDPGKLPQEALESTGQNQCPIAMDHEQSSISPITDQRYHIAQKTGAACESQDFLFGEQLEKTDLDVDLMTFQLPDEQDTNSLFSLFSQEETQKTLQDLLSNVQMSSPVNSELTEVQDCDSLSDFHQ